MMQPPFQMRADLRQVDVPVVLRRSRRESAPCPARSRRSARRRARRARSSIDLLRDPCRRTPASGVGPADRVRGRDALVLQARQHARVERRGDGRDRDAEIERDLRRPLARCPSGPPCRARRRPAAASVSGSIDAAHLARSARRGTTRAGRSFHSLEDVRRSRRAVSPRPRRSTSHDSAMSCMSPYSMPLWTILTKWPAPSGPTWVTHGPASVLRGDRLEHVLDARAHASSDPPGMIDGPKRAPSSPPDTPQPTKWMPARAQRRLAPARVLEPRVAAVDERRRPRSSSGRILSIVCVDGLARRDHHQDPARPLERRGERLERLRAGERVAGWSRRNSSTHSGLEVPDRDRQAARLDVERQVAPHGAQADDAERVPLITTPPRSRARARTRGRATGCAVPPTAAPPGSRRRATPPATSRVWPALAADSTHVRLFGQPQVQIERRRSATRRSIGDAPGRCPGSQSPPCLPIAARSSSTRRTATPPPDRTPRCTAA